MRTLIVHCHPEPSSFNAALTDVATDEVASSTVDIESFHLKRSGGAVIGMLPDIAGRVPDEFGGPRPRRCGRTPRC